MNDKRRKITPEQREEIIRLFNEEGMSQRRLAKDFGVSRQYIALIVYPERQANVKAYLKEKRKEGRFGMSKEKWNEAMRKHRAHKKELYEQLRKESV